MLAFILFLNTKDFVFEYLNTISDTKVYINIGLESVDDKTLNILGKPIDSLSVKQSFEKMVYINKNYLNIEVTANFILDLSFSREHFESLIHLIRDSVKKPYYKGTIYLSPLKNNDKMALLKKGYGIKKTELFANVFIYNSEILMKFKIENLFICLFL